MSPLSANVLPWSDLVADGDVASHVQRIIAAVIERYGHLNVLINNAGMSGNTYRQLREGGMNGIADTPTEHWNELMRNNLDFVSYIWEMNTSSVNGR